MYSIGNTGSEGGVSDTASGSVNSVVPNIVTLRDVEHMLVQEDSTSYRTRGELRVRLGAALQQLALITTQLGTRYNLHSPISQLPPEIMRQIFATVASTDLPEHRHLEERFTNHLLPGRLGWVALSHVCHHWRCMLLDMPSLWAAHVCAFPTALDVFLERSQMCPLTIRFNAGQHLRWRSEELLRHILPWFRRASTIAVTIPEGSDLYDEIMNISSLANPSILEDINVRVIVNKRRKSQILLDQPSLPFPFLRRLSLYDVLLPWNMSTVTALELSRFEHFIPGFPDLYKFYAFLSASPNLETLAVENWLPKSSVMDQANLPVLDFPSLSRLSISGGVETCHAFLRSLRIPGRAELNFNFTIDDFEEDYDTLRGPVGQLLSAAWKHISGDRANVANDRRWCLSLELETEYTSQIRIFTRDEEMKPFCDHPLEPSFPCFRDLLRIRIPFHTFSFFRELGPILESGGLAPTEVEILDIRYHNIQLRRETLTGWRELFKIFPNVHTLFINSHRAGNHPVRELPQLLSEPADCSEDLHTSTPVVLPALRYLWMHHVTAECPEYTTEGLLCFQYDILKMLRYRVGVGLQHLRLGRVLTELDDGFPEHAAALRESFVGRASKVLPIVWENRFKDCDHELPWYTW